MSQEDRDRAVARLAHPADDSLATLLEKIETCGIPRRTLMRKAGLDYDAFNSWKTGKRTPRAASLHKVAFALHCLAGDLKGLADEVDEVGKARFTPSQDDHAYARELGRRWRDGEFRQAAELGDEPRALAQTHPGEGLV